MPDLWTLFISVLRHSVQNLIFDVIRLSGFLACTVPEKKTALLPVVMNKAKLYCCAPAWWHVTRVCRKTWYSSTDTWSWVVGWYGWTEFSWCTATIHKPPSSPSKGQFCFLNPPAEFCTVSCCSFISAVHAFRSTLEWCIYAVRWFGIWSIVLYQCFGQMLVKTVYIRIIYSASLFISISGFHVILGFFTSLYHSDHSDFKINTFYSG